MPGERARVIPARLRAGVAIWLLVTGGTLAVCLLGPKSYQSSVTFQVADARLRSVFVELLTSQAVLGRALVLLDAPDSPAAKAWRQARQATSRDEGAFKSALAGLDAEAQRRERDPAASGEVRAAARDLGRSVAVEVPHGGGAGTSEVLRVTVTRRGPVERVQMAADLLAGCCLDRCRECQAEAAAIAAESARARLDDLRRQRVEPAEQALRSFVEHELGSPSDVIALEQIGRPGAAPGGQLVVRRLQEEMIANDAKLAGARQLRRRLLGQLPPVLWNGPRADAAGEPTVPEAAQVDVLDDKQLGEAVMIVPAETLNESEVLRQLKAREGELLVTVHRLKATHEEDSQALQQKRAELVHTRRQILREVICEAAALEVTSTALQVRQEELGGKVDAEMRRLNALAARLPRYTALKTAAALAGEEYRRASAELAARLVAAPRDATAIRVLQPATLPEPAEAVYPRTGLYTAIAAAIGLLLATGYALLARRFDRTVPSMKTADHRLGVPVVGTIGRHRGGLVA